MENVGLLFFGFLVGAFGTLIGAGGGFILIPTLLFLYPSESPALITSISLVVVFMNSFSGTIAYAKKGRVDFRSGMIFTLASLPGAILGATSITHVSRSVFEPTFGILLLVAGLFLLWKSQNDSQRAITYLFQPKRIFLVGIPVSAGVGFISSFFGIGGGIIHVPLLIHALNFPFHIATATSHFVLALTSLVGSTVHFLNGNLNGALNKVLSLGAGAIFGAQLGAKLSSVIDVKWLNRALAFALILLAIRFLRPVIL